MTGTGTVHRSLRSFLRDSFRIVALVGLVVLLLAAGMLAYGARPERQVNTETVEVLWQDDDHRIIQLSNGCTADQSRWDDGSNWRTDEVACPDR